MEEKKQVLSNQELENANGGSAAELRKDIGYRVERDEVAVIGHSKAVLGCLRH